jgi:hypothetical protein
MAFNAEIESQLSKGRSRVTNAGVDGRTVIAGVDGRTLWARRLRDLIQLHLADLAGEDAVSEAEKSIIRRAATLTVELERMESDFALAGGAQPAQLELYQRTANSLRRLLESVGLERRAKTIVPTLSEYLEARTVVPTEDGVA